ncbi:MAG: DUF5689 domain-containing protein [Bacteroidota bacterium]
MRKITLLLTMVFVAVLFSTNNLVANSQKGTMVDVSDIQTLRAQEADGTTVYVLTGEAILTYQQSYRNKKWIQDETAGIEIDDNDGIITTVYSIGDGITGIQGTLNLYNNKMQFIPVEDPGEPTSTDNEPLIVEKTLTDLTADDQGRLVLVTDLSFDAAHHGDDFATGQNYDVSDLSGDGVFRTEFYEVEYIGAPIPTEVIDVVAIVHVYNETIQITPRSFADMGITDMHSVYALRNQEADGTTEYTLTNEVFLTYQQSFRGQKYIEDATAGILIDDNGGTITTEYAIYDGITGITGTLTSYGNMLQFVPVADPGAATSQDNEIIPPVLSLEDFNENFMDYQARLVTIENIEFDVEVDATFANGTVYNLADITDPAITGEFRTTFYDVDYIGDLVPAGPVLITGLPNSTNDGDFITSRNWTDIEALTAYSVTFEVIDEAAAPIADAEITFLGETHPAGTYLFEDVTVGTHPYEVFKDGYLIAEGDVAVVDENVTQTVVMVEIDDNLVTVFPWTEDFDENVIPPATWEEYILGEGGWITVERGTGYAAHHNFTDEGSIADSWLVTPQISVPVEERMFLKFSENNAYMNYYGYSGVHISTSSGNPELGNYVEVYESNTPIADYTEKYIDLSAYAGQIIYIAFVYQGEFAHQWWIDDVSIEESQAVEVSTLAELRALGEDIPALYTGEATIVAMDGYRNRKFLQDETAAIMIDDYDGIITTEYDLYDVISNVSGEINIYNEMLQFVPDQDTDPATENNPVEPVIFLIDEVTSDDQAKLIKLENVSFVDITEGQLFENGTNYTITDGVNEFVLRTDFWNVDYIETEIPHNQLSITGVIIQYNEDFQIVPRFAADIEDYVSEFVAVVSTDPANGEENVSIDTDIVVTFDRNVIESDGFGDISVDYSEGSVDFTTNLTDNVLTITPNAELNYNIEYTVVIPVDAVADAEDEMLVMENEYTFSFITEQETSIDEIETASISVFPNPAKERFTVESSELITNIRIISITGQVIKNIELNSLQTEISVDDILSGIYLIQVETENQTITERIQILR